VNLQRNTTDKDQSERRNPKRSDEWQTCKGILTKLPNLKRRGTAEPERER
jgi:hypothetical protein